MINLRQNLVRSEDVLPDGPVIADVIDAAGEEKFEGRSTGEEGDDSAETFRGKGVKPQRLLPRHAFDDKIFQGAVDLLEYIHKKGMRGAAKPGRMIGQRLLVDIRHSIEV
jgi:hypothetical protein